MKILIILLSGLLIIANFAAIYYLDAQLDRWFRFGATLIFLLFFLYEFLGNKRLLFVFLLVTLCDALLIFYELPYFKHIIYAIRILAYINLILLVFPSLSKLKIGLFTGAVSVFIISIDIYLLNEMAESLPAKDQNPLFLTLFYGLGIISLTIVAVAISYLNRFADRKAFLLVIVSFGFVLSDIFYYNAYYLGFEEFYYLDRFVNIIGMLALLFFARSMIKNAENSESKQLSRTSQ